jgi:head-tail adaptor
VNIPLDREITVEYKSVTQDAVYGTDVVTWIPLVALPGSPVVGRRFPANIQDVMPSRSESVQQGLIVGRQQTRLRMRYRNDIDSGMRVTVHGDSDVVYQIVAGPAEIGGRKQYLEMILEKITS